MKISIPFVGVLYQNYICCMQKSQAYTGYFIKKNAVSVEMKKYLKKRKI